MDHPLDRESKLLRIFIGENDKIAHKPLYSQIVSEAKESGMAGATVLRGMLSYGAGSIIHTAKIIEISQDLPVVIEIIDSEEKINDFLPSLKQMMEEANCGGIITIEKANVIYYRSKKREADG